MKLCSQCKTEKPLTAFYVMKSGKPDGRCKECRRANAKADHYARREQHLQRMKERHRANRDAEILAMRERNPKYYQDNRERLLEKYRGRREDEVERMRSDRASLADYYVRGLMAQHSTSLNGTDLPQPLVDAHREPLKLKRELRNHSHEKC